MLIFLVDQCRPPDFQVEGRGFESRFLLPYHPVPEPISWIHHIAFFCLILPIFAFSSRQENSPEIPFCGRFALSYCLALPFDSLV